ncbi:MAG: hypothetical protein K8R87_07415 [Verrucomicrobia bacterium]|nr:hypothetical protein [Verrucomicrobiota bacterium]
MTHEEFSRKGGQSKSARKVKAARKAMAKINAARKAKQKAERARKIAITLANKNPARP